MALHSDKERMLLTISGGKLVKYEILPFRKRYEDFLGRKGDPSSNLVKCEDLVSNKGGSSNQSQLLAIEEVARYLEIALTDEMLVSIQGSLFGKKDERTQSPTFTKGRTDSRENELVVELIYLVDD